MVWMEFVLLVTLFIQFEIVLALDCACWYPSTTWDSIGPKLAVVTADFISLDFFDLVGINLVYFIAITLNDLD